jgi:hypothetical protein
MIIFLPVIVFYSFKYKMYVLLYLVKIVNIFSIYPVYETFHFAPSLKKNRKRKFFLVEPRP